MLILIGLLIKLQLGLLNDFDYLLVTDYGKVSSINSM